MDPTAPRGFRWAKLGAMGLEEENPISWSRLSSGEGMASGDKGALGRLGARCEGSGTVGTDRGGTGKRDRQRVPGGKCRVPLSQPHKASGIRPGRGGRSGDPWGWGDRLVASCQGWGGFGRWLCPGKGRRQGGTPSLAGIPPRHPAMLQSRLSLAAAQAGRAPLGECEPPFPTPPPPPHFPSTPLTRGPPQHCTSSVGPLLG